MSWSRNPQCSTLLRNWLADSDFKHRETLRAYIGLSVFLPRKWFRETATGLESLSAAANGLARKFPKGQSRLSACWPRTKCETYSQNELKSVQYETVLTLGWTDGADVLHRVSEYPGNKSRINRRLPVRRQPEARHEATHPSVDSHPSQSSGPVRG
jgi:hypothetical protein